jgi:hypothetical protein
MSREKCDNAPVVDIPVMCDAQHITMIYPFYDNPAFLAEQLKWWHQWSPELRHWVSLIVVDDCGPIPAAEILKGSVLPFKTRLFRIEKDVRWNWLAARNIGAYEAENGWLFLTDIDHVLTPEVAEKLVRGFHRKEIIYRFSRKEHTGEDIHPHPNSWFMTKQKYWQVGGYDETLSGYYGTDGEYRSRCAATAEIKRFSDALVRYERLGDSSTRKYLRKQPEDAKVRQLIRARKANWKPKTLSFPYHEVNLGE